MACWGVFAVIASAFVITAITFSVIASEAKQSNLLSHNAHNIQTKDCFVTSLLSGDGGEPSCCRSNRPSRHCERSVAISLICLYVDCRLLRHFVPRNDERGLIPRGYAGRFFQPLRHSVPPPLAGEAFLLVIAEQSNLTVGVYDISILLLHTLKILCYSKIEMSVNFAKIEMSVAYDLFVLIN